MVYFVENNKPAVELLRRNLKSLSIEGSFQLLQQESAYAITQLERQQIKPDYIFLDPPYGLREAYPEILGKLANYSLSKGALIIAEHEKRFDPGEKFGDLQRIRKLLQGDAGLSFYRRVQNHNFLTAETQSAPR